MNGKTVLILGGGVGGIVTANELRRKLGPQHRVILVNKGAEYVFTPSLLWVIVGWRQPGQITRDLRRLVRPGVEVLPAEVKEIDLERQRVRAGDRDLAYDYLVLALGADLAPGAMPGYAGAAHNFFEPEGAAGLWSSLQRFQGGRLVVLVSGIPYKCPAAPHETALLIDDALRRRGIRGRCRVEVFTPEPQPMPVAGPAMGEAIVGLLGSRGIRFHPSVQPAAVDAEKRELVFQDGRREPFDLLAAVPPHQPPAVVRNLPLANQAGWIPVDKHTLQTNHHHVYAIGDVAAITLANGRPLPKAGVFAHAQAKVVAQRLAGEIQGAQAQTSFEGVGYCWLEMGGGQAGFTSGEFYAEPGPVVGLPRSGRLWHWGKVLYEKYWLGEGIIREAARLGLNLGSKALGIGVSL